jgi:molybdopterin-biosynthesis enzyme MoeA-like protein
MLGEKRNSNQEWMLRRLWELNYPALASLSVGDDPAQISDWVRHLDRSGYRPILVSGGIGGTHDDRTREAIAIALDVELTRHPDCFAILSARYGNTFTPQRQRMAMLPSGAELIDNPLGAPGFCIGNVYAFPGFPNMLQPMVNDVLVKILPYDPTQWQTIEARLASPEGDIAMAIEEFGKAHPQWRIGIYPSTKNFRRETAVRVRYRADSPQAAPVIEKFLTTLAGDLNVTLYIEPKHE